MLDEGLVAGLELLGLQGRVLCASERDAYAAATLLARMEDQSLEPFPIWAGNFEDAGWGRWHGRVDCLVAGFPCQPWSAAGKREGEGDERWLWPGIFRVIQETQPWLCFLENVPGLVSGGGLEPILADLASIGFDAEWIAIRADDVGASHERERIFILAWRPGDLGFASLNGRERRWLHEPAGRIGDADAVRSSENVGDAQCGRRNARQPGPAESQAGCSSVLRGERLADPGCLRSLGLEHEPLSERGEAPGLGNGELELAHADGIGRRGQGDAGRASGEPYDGGAHLADAEQPGLQGRGPSEPGGWPLFAPGPQDPIWRDIIAECPWLAPAVESEFCCLVDGKPFLVDASRADQLRSSGNGVVALQAALAFVILVERGVK